MPETSKEFLVTINDLGDVLRVRFVRDGAAVVRFTVQFEAVFDDAYWPVVRYDSAHEHAHQDLLDWRGRTIKKTPMRSDVSYNDAMTAAIDDLTSNWERYRQAFLERRR